MNDWTFNSTSRAGAAPTDRALGAEVQSAESAAAGMEAFARFKPDLLVCDVAMPDEDGYRRNDQCRWSVVWTLRTGAR